MPQVNNGLDQMIGEVQRGESIATIMDRKVDLPNVQHLAAFKKADAKLQIAYAEVYAPDIPDSHGDFMVAEEIRKMAHDFLRKGLTKNVDVEHDNELTGSAVVESFIAREGDSDFIVGAWVAGVHIPDIELWKQVESGEINGFSLQGVGMQTEKTVLLTIPPIIQGFTSEDEGDGHWHAFEVRFSDDGDFLGGQTVKTFPEAHPEHDHAIKRGTVTEPGGDAGDPHVHRFSFVEGLESAAA